MPFVQFIVAVVQMIACISVLAAGGATYPIRDGVLLCGGIAVTLSCVNFALLIASWHDNAPASESTDKSLEQP